MSSGLLQLRVWRAAAEAKDDDDDGEDDDDDGEDEKVEEDGDDGDDGEEEDGDGDDAQDALEADPPPRTRSGAEGPPSVPPADAMRSKSATQIADAAVILVFVRAKIPRDEARRRERRVSAQHSTAPLAPRTWRRQPRMLARK